MLAAPRDDPAAETHALRSDAGEPCGAPQLLETLGRPGTIEVVDAPREERADVSPPRRHGARERRTAAPRRARPAPSRSQRPTRPISAPGRARRPSPRATGRTGRARTRRPATRTSPRPSRRGAGRAPGAATGRRLERRSQRG